MFELGIFLFNLGLSLCKLGLSLSKHGLWLSKLDLYPPTPRRVGIKSQPTDIDSPDDRYIPGNPTPGETRFSLLSGAIPVRFSSHGGGGKEREVGVGRCSPSQPTK